MKQTLILLTLLFVLSCNEKSVKKNDTKVLQSLNLNSSTLEILNKKHDPSRYIKPIITENGLNYQFQKIDSANYETLRQSIVSTQLPKDDYSKFLSINDSSIVVKFNDGKKDTFHNRINKNGVEYAYENFSKKNNYLIISYFDSEANFYQLYNLNKSGKYYGLFETQKLSPNGEILVSHSDMLTNPFTNRGLLIVRFKDSETFIDLDISDMDWELKKFDWINNNYAILKLEIYKSKSSDFLENEYCLMKID